MSDETTTNSLPAEAFTRPVSGNTICEGDKLYDAFVSEINRSLEHYQIQRGMPPPSKLLIDPGFKHKEWLNCLLSKLSINTELFDLSKLFNLKQKIEDKNQILCLSVIGAGLSFGEKSNEKEYEQTNEEESLANDQNEGDNKDEKIMESKDDTKG